MVVDTSVLVAIFRHEPEEPIFLEAIEDAERTFISTVSIVEAMSVLCSRRGGATRNHVERLVGRLGLAVEPVDEAQCQAAIDALLAYGKGRHPARLNLGDCFTYALAKVRGLPLLFKGDDFARTDIVPAWRPR